MPGERGANRTVKEQTVLVDVGDNKNVSALSVINSVEAEVGEGVVEACVPKSGNVYDITLKELEAVDLLCDTGFKVNNVKFQPNAVFSKQKMVSLLNVSYYVTDDELTKKLEDFGAELISPIKRRMHPGTTIADGTRYVVVRFPEFRQSLPYKSGHLARNCPKPRCNKCHRYPANCTCEPVRGYDRPDTEPQDDLNAEDSNVENDNATNDEQMEEDEEVKNDDRDDVDDTLNLDDRDDTTDVKENSDVNTAQDELNLDENTAQDDLNLDENPKTDSGNNTSDDDEQTEVMTVHEHSKDNLIDNELYFA
ncbi:Hypothetical predicted protein [Mytilus galloprovincialis]|uniref:Uncharacterized protein n=1 Tax=Mytilus galloprovincialis TaxID=29158 RepID=A0A8B6GH11_MYTGA|nr:Hypothetical predicted protein [Mytilus galloprovincialis]